MSDEVRMLEAARAAVSQASVICRAVQSRLSDSIKLTKSDDSPVTIADFASQAVIARTLAERLGRVTLVGEESSAAIRQQLARDDTRIARAIVDAVQPVWPGATLDDVLEAIDLGSAEPPRDSLHGFWTVDPIDGTKGFLRNGQYSICLAWVEHGSPVIGVVGCPNLSPDLGLPLDEHDPHGTLYYAIAAEGLAEAPCDDPAARPLPIKRLGAAEGEAVRLVESIEISWARHSDTERVLEHLGEPAEPVRLDGQTKYAVVARGQADIYLRLPSRKGYVERIWDHAAGSLIAIEAGCAVTDVHGEPLDFSHGKGLERNSGIIAAPPALHGRALGIIQKLKFDRPPESSEANTPGI